MHSEHKKPASFHSSPQEALHAPLEVFLYLSCLHGGTGVEAPDFIAVVDAEEGRIVHEPAMPSVCDPSENGSRSPATRASVSPAMPRSPPPPGRRTPSASSGRGPSASRRPGSTESAMRLTGGRKYGASRFLWSPRRETLTPLRDL
jgi:hypothetical protein